MGLWILEGGIDINLGSPARAGDFVFNLYLV